MRRASGSRRRILASVLSAEFAAVLPVHSAGAATSEISLRGAGSTFSAALYNQWIETYHR